MTDATEHTVDRNDRLVILAHRSGRVIEWYDFYLYGSLAAIITAQFFYPARADGALVNKPLVVAILFLLVLYVTMVYGPIAAALVEMFPTNIRYTSMSLPCHIGNGWFGGFLPTTAFAMVAATGNTYCGLWYPVVVALVTVVIGFLFIKDRKDVDLHA